MIHVFQSDVAVAIGLNAAIILQNLHFWCEKNRANKTNFYDGYYWTFNSVKAYEEMFPYMTKNKINTALAKLEQDGYIVSGNYNVSTYDRTKWYALTEKGYQMIENQKCIYQKSEMDLLEIRNGFTQNQKPIPDINTDIYTDNILDSKESNCQTRKSSDVKQCVDAWNALTEYGIKPVSRLNSTSQRYQRLSARISEYGVDNVLKSIEKIKGSSFLQGKASAKHKWVITFDWFVLPNNFPKVLDGNYDDKCKMNENAMSNGNDKEWQ